MAYEATNWVWTPDETTNFNYTSNLATMGSSIETTVGKYVYNAEGTATPTDTTNFAPYTTGNVIRLIRNGRFVTLIFTWGVTTPNYIRGLDYKVFASIPPGFRPKETFYQIMQGSSYTSWLLSISTSGDIRASRQSADSAPSSSYWMPCNVSYLAED